MDNSKKLKAESCSDDLRSGQDQAIASVLSSTPIGPGLGTTTTKIDDRISLHQQPTQYSDQTTALISAPFPYPRVIESGSSVTTAPQSIPTTPGPTASQGSLRPAVVTTYPVRTRNQLEVGIPAQQNSPRPGFFAGAKDVDASHSNFTDVAGDHVNIDIAGDVIINQGNDISALNKLRRTKNVGHRSEHHRSCLPGTRKAELERIEKWMDDPTDTRVYWLNGRAGTGKSTIAQTFAERSSAKGRLGASFFCSRDFPDRRNIHLIFPTIAFGLAQRYPQFRVALMEVMSSSPDAADESLAIQVEDLLVRPLESTKLSTIIIIDALDECEDDEPASAILPLLARHIDTIPSVKFFITGRPEAPIRTGFRLPVLQAHTTVFVLHDVDESSVNRDIEHYLRTRLSEIALSRGYSDFTEPWPADDDIALLVKRCSGLFIVASITTRIIGDRHVEPRKQLKIVIREADSTVREGRLGVDETYHQVFLRSVEGVGNLDTDFVGLQQLVVGSIVLVFSPLSCVDLAKILDLPQEEVRSAIHLLHSVLIVPDSNTQLLQICHKSFADFLTDPRRCADRRFQIDRSDLHTKLGMHCLRLMNGSLKQNICDFPPYAMNEDIDGLDARREKYISGGLEYACRSWAKHLRFASRGCDDVGHIVSLLECFFRHHLLSWMEVLSIVGDTRCAVYSIRDVRSWFTDVDASDTDLLDIIQDSERFILRFFDVIEASSCHIYHSALPWSPRSSLIRGLYQDQLLTEVKMFNAIDDTWDASMRTIQTRNDVRHMAFSHNDDFIAVAEAGSVEVFETLTGHRRTTLIGPKTTTYGSLGFSPDDTLLATGDSDNIISVWDLQTGGLVCALAGHTAYIQSIAFSPCGTMIASGSPDRTVRVWNVSSRDCRCVLEGHSNPVESVCWSARKNEVISGSSDRTVRMWDINGMRCAKIFSSGDEAGVGFVACSPDSSSIAAGSARNMMKVFNTRTGDVFRTIPTDGLVLSIRFLDQDTLMYATNQRKFLIHDLTQKTNTPTLKSKTWLKGWLRKDRLGFESLQSRTRHSKTNPTNDANLLTFEYKGYGTVISSDGTRIASKTSAKAVTVWQTYGPSTNHDTTSHRRHVESVAFSRDGQLVASGSWDQTAKLWDPTSGRCLYTFSHPEPVVFVVFSPDSTLLASVTDFQIIRIWDTRAHKHLFTLDTSRRHYNMRIGLSPNGNQIVSLGDYKHLELWEVATGKQLASVKVESPFYYKVGFGVDGTSVSLESNDSVMRYRISPIQSSSDNDTDEHSSPPMQFVPLHDAQPSVSSHLCYRPRSEWIIDERKRRVLWVPPDLRDGSDSCEKNAVIGSDSRRLVFFDISDVQIEKLKERERSKKDMEDRLKGLKRKRKGALDNAQADDEDFNIAVEDAISDRPSKRHKGPGGGSSSDSEEHVEKSRGWKKQK